MTRPVPVIALCSCAAALALSACGTTTSTSSFKGEQHEAAQSVADLQSDVAASSNSKLCTNDLSSGIVKRLGGRKACETAVKHQLTQIDNPEVTIQSVKIAPGGKTATATVKSIHDGKSRTGTVALVKEGGRWKVSGP
jgi:ABC-type oligopeptide transport system substrate-binding subunit